MNVRLTRLAVVVTSVASLGASSLAAASMTPGGATVLRGLASAVRTVALSVGPLSVLAGGGGGGCVTSGPSSGPTSGPVSGPCPPPPCAPSGGGFGPPSVKGTTTTVRVDSPAVLIDACDVFVEVTYNCFPPVFGPPFGQVAVSEITPGQGGGGSFTPICDDHQQTQSVLVTGNFSPGEAAASVFLCGLDCNGDSREIKIVIK